MDLLATNVGFAKKEALGAYLKHAYSSNIAMYDKFPELNTIADKNEILSKAINKVIVGKVPLTAAQCWSSWLLALGACSSSCFFLTGGLGEDYETCWWACSAAASSGAGWCFLLAD